MKAAFLAFLLISSIVFAMRLQIIEPVRGTLVEGSTLDLGVIGPGQKVVVIAERRSGEISRYAAGSREALWDRLFVEALPTGWTSEPSKIYEDPFQAFVTVSPDADDGEYVFSLRTWDEYDGVSPLVVNAKVRVSRDVLGLKVQNAVVRTGVDQPAVFFLTLQNSGSASDVFELSTRGLPAAWSTKRSLFVPHNTVVNIAYELIPKEHGEYTAVFRSASLSNPRILKEETVYLKTETSVWNDARSAANGVLLFPSIQQTLYAFIAFIAHLIG